MMSERQKLILNRLHKQGSVNVVDLVELCHTSESTIRRDLAELDEQGLLKRVHGGATLIPKESNTTEDPLNERQNIHMDEKEQIGKYAAALIEANDVVYIDAGSTTLSLINHLKEKDALYITNGLMQAHMLSLKGYHVICIGGEIRGITGACVGARTLQGISKYHFTKGIFGTNGVDVEHGFTTVDGEEAAIKEHAINHCAMRYVLCDKSKFQMVCPITFADIDDAIIITTHCDNTEINHLGTIVEVEKQ